MNKEFNNKCVLCGDVIYLKKFCYKHYKLVRKLKVESEDIETIKLALEENENTSRKYIKNKSKKDRCKICGQPCNGNLCIIHKKISNYLDKE